MSGPLGYIIVIFFLGVIVLYFVAQLPAMRRRRQRRQLESMRRALVEEGLDPDSPEGQRALRLRMKNAHRQDRGAIMTNIDGAGGMGVDN